MSIVTSPPASGNPGRSSVGPADPWQDYLADHLDKFRAYFYRYFQRYRPEERLERVQEGIAQLCLVLSREETRGCKRLNCWSVYARRAASKVARGSSCTRVNGQNADLLDKPHFSGVYTEDKHYTPDHVARLCFSEWLDTLPADLRDTAELLLQDYTLAEVADKLQRSPSAIGGRRKRLQKSLSDHLGGGPNSA